MCSDLWSPCYCYVMKRERESFNKGGNSNSSGEERLVKQELVSRREVIFTGHKLIVIKI